MIAKLCEACGGGCSVADHEQEYGQEPFNERKREVMQELAREIVREAGMHPDPRVPYWQCWRYCC